MMQQSLRASPSVKKRAKSVYSQRNLGTIKDRKREKQQEKEVTNGETILRILRMRYAIHLLFLKVLRRTLTRPFRPGTSDFISQQLHAMTSMQAEREAQTQARSQNRRIQRPRQGGGASISMIPEVPPLPPLPPKTS